MFSFLIQKFALGIFLPKLLNVTSLLNAGLLEEKRKEGEKLKPCLTAYNFTKKLVYIFSSFLIRCPFLSYILQLAEKEHW